MPSVLESAGVVAILCAAVAVVTSSGASAQGCEIAGTYVGNAPARGRCPILDLTLEVKKGPLSSCGLTGKVTYDRWTERSVECTQMEFDSDAGYELRGKLRRELSLQTDDFRATAGPDDCSVMRVRIPRSFAACEINLTKEP